MTTVPLQTGIEELVAELLDELDVTVLDDDDSPLVLEDELDELEFDRVDEAEELEELDELVFDDVELDWLEVIVGLDMLVV